MGVYGLNISDYNKKCNFSKLEDNCIKTKSLEYSYLLVYGDVYNINYQLDMFRIITQIIINPFILLAGLIFNMLAIISLNNKNNQNLREAIFVYARINFTFNFLFCILGCLKMLNKCIEIDDFYCPFYFTNINLQYFDIIMFKFFSSSIKLAALSLKFLFQLVG